MKLTVANANITNTLSTARITLGNASVVQSLTLGNVSVAPSQISVGNTSITPTVVSVPALVLGGSQFAGGLQGGIINYQEFTANGTWYNPYANASVNSSLTGYEQVLIMAWGGGGGGASGASLEGGGGGGACFIGVSSLNDLTSTCSVNVGSGGAAGLAGGNSIFVCNSSSTITAYGGGGAQRDGGGGGGGLLSAGLTATADNGAVGGSPLNSTSSTYGGGDGSNNSSGSVGGTSIFGGGGGGSKTTGLGGISIYGGAGGSYGIVNSTVSIFGGRGGNNTVAPTTPGGGASGQTNLTGARGEVRVWVFGPAGTTVGAPTYTLTANTNTIYEGSSILYTVATTNVPNSTALYYTLNNSSIAVATDFTTAVNGSVIINGGTGTFTLTANNDTDSANEAFQIDVRTGSTSGSIVASNGSVSIVPAIQYIGTSVAEGGSSIAWPSGTAAGDSAIILYRYNSTASQTFNWTGSTLEYDDIMVYNTGQGSQYSYAAAYSKLNLIASDISSPPTYSDSFPAYSVIVFRGASSIIARGSNPGVNASQGITGTSISLTGFTKSASAKNILTAVIDRDASGNATEPTGWTLLNKNATTYSTWAAANILASDYSGGTITWTGLDNTYTQCAFVFEIT